MDQRDSSDQRLQRIARDPRYLALVRGRGRLGWMLSIVVMTIFFGYMLLVAFAGPFLGTPIGTMTMTIGIPIGLFVILSAIVLTGLYVSIANRRFDAETAALLQEHNA